MKEAAQRIKLIMAKQGRSLYWLSQQLKHDLSSMKKTLDGDRRMTLDFAVAAARALGARPAYVTCAHGTMYEEPDPLKLAHPLDLALAYDRGRYSPEAIARVKAYRDAHPDEECSPRQWTAMLKTRQTELLDDLVQESENN